MLKTIPCPDCDGRGFITEFTERSVLVKKCSACNGLGQIEVPTTNADRIRAMSDEELAKFIGCIYYGYEDCTLIIGKYRFDTFHDFKEWLKQSVDKEDEL